MHHHSRSGDLMIDAIPHSVAVLDATGTITRVNRAWREVARSAAMQCRVDPGVNYLEVCDNAKGAAASDAIAVAKGIRDVLARHVGAFRHQYACEIESQGLHWFSLEATSLDDCGTDRVLLTHFDATAAIVARGLSVHRDSLLALLLESISDVAIYLLDLEGCIRTWNHGAEAMTGWTLHEVMGKSYDITFSHADRASGVPALHLAQSKEHGICRGEGTRVRKDGTRIDVAFSLYAVRDTDGAVSGYAKIARNITDSRIAAAELQRAMDALELRNHEMEQFVYTVSHDLKTPLVTVSGFAGHALQDLNAGRLDRLPQFIERMAAAATRMKGTIDDLLALSRIGRIEGPHTSVPLGPVIQAVVSSMDEQVQLVSVRVHIETGLPSISADADRIRELLENLLDNALKYGCPSPGARIDIGARVVSDHVELFVMDHGPGIPEAARERVFAIFHRLNTDQVGTGVGLAIVRRIAEVHAGKAWVEPTPGGGATFVVSFPISSESHTDEYRPSLAGSDEVSHATQGFH